MKVGIHGASGRVGGELLRLLQTSPLFTLGGAVVSPSSNKLGESALGRIKFETLSEEILRACDVWLDFSSAASSLTLAELCSKHSIALLIGSTGHTATQVDALRGYAKSCPLLLAPNTSAAVFLLKHLSKVAQRVLGADFDIEIVESHHRNKKDAPSGTALAIARDLCAAGDLKLCESRTGHSLSRVGTIGIASVRGGDVVGEHTVQFLGQGERLELCHKATDRSIFARGALKLAECLVGASSGFYSPSDFYSKMV